MVEIAGEIYDIDIARIDLSYKLINYNIDTTKIM